MSLLQKVKRGLGLGPKRTSETTQQKLGTSDTYEENTKRMKPGELGDEYAELHVAVLEYKEAAFAAASRMYGRITAAGYSITDVKLTTFYPVDRHRVTGVLHHPRTAEVELTVVAAKASGAVRITFKV